MSSPQVSTIPGVWGHQTRGFAEHPSRLPGQEVSDEESSEARGAARAAEPFRRRFLKHCFGSNGPLAFVFLPPRAFTKRSLKCWKAGKRFCLCSRRVLCGLGKPKDGSVCVCVEFLRAPFQPGCSGSTQMPFRSLHVRSAQVRPCSTAHTQITDLFRVPPKNGAGRGQHDMI